MKIQLLLCSLLLLLPIKGFSQEKLTIAFGNALAPWVIPQSDSGIVVELISAALEPVGYKIVPLYFPYSRRINSYRQGLVDVASDMNSNTMSAEDLEGFLSEPVYQYHNYLISLTESNLTFNTLEDIGNHSLISWQGAKEHLSDHYKNLMDKNPNYTETHDQALQVKMLFLKRFDVAQMDLQIFKYYRNQIHQSGGINTSAKVDLFPILGASPNGFLFKDEKIKNLFDERIKQLKTSGEYQKIFDKYTVAVKSP
ncbi:MAG: substrate-binding periplasmic protein [Thalassotalea sp.]